MGKATKAFRQEKSALAQRFETLRDAATTEVYAAKVGMPRQQWERYENDAAKPSLDLLIRIAARAPCSLDWLLRGVDVEQPSQDTSASVLREVDMSTDGWQALLKVRKVFTQKSAPAGVREILRDAIDSAARQVDAAAQRIAVKTRRRR